MFGKTLQRPANMPDPVFGEAEPVAYFAGRAKLPIISVGVPVQHIKQRLLFWCSCLILFVLPVQLRYFVPGQPVPFLFF